MWDSLPPVASVALGTDLPPVTGSGAAASKGIFEEDSRSTPASLRAVPTPPHHRASANTMAGTHPLSGAPPLSSMGPLTPPPSAMSSAHTSADTAEASTSELPATPAGVLPPVSQRGTPLSATPPEPPQHDEVPPPLHGLASAPVAAAVCHTHANTTNGPTEEPYHRLLPVFDRISSTWAVDGSGGPLVSTTFSPPPQVPDVGRATPTQQQLLQQHPSPHQPCHQRQRPHSPSSFKHPARPGRSTSPGPVPFSMGYTLHSGDGGYGDMAAASGSGSGYGVYHEHSHALRRLPGAERRARIGASLPSLTGSLSSPPHSPTMDSDHAQSTLPAAEEDEAFFDRPPSLPLGGDGDSHGAMTAAAAPTAVEAATAAGEGVRPQPQLRQPHRNPFLSGEAADADTDRNGEREHGNSNNREGDSGGVNSRGKSDRNTDDATTGIWESASYRSRDAKALAPTTMHPPPQASPHRTLPLPSRRQRESASNRESHDRDSLMSGMGGGGRQGMANTCSDEGAQPAMMIMARTGNNGATSPFSAVPDARTDTASASAVQLPTAPAAATAAAAGYGALTNVSVPASQGVAAGVVAAQPAIDGHPHPPQTAFDSQQSPSPRRHHSQFHQPVPAQPPQQYDHVVDQSMTPRHPVLPVTSHIWSPRAVPESVAFPPPATVASASPAPSVDNRSWMSATATEATNTSIFGDEHRMSFYNNNASMARSFYFPEGLGPASAAPAGGASVHLSSARGGSVEGYGMSLYHPPLGPAAAAIATTAASPQAAVALQPHSAMGCGGSNSNSNSNSNRASGAGVHSTPTSVSGGSFTSAGEMSTADHPQGYQPHSYSSPPQSRWYASRFSSKSASMNALTATTTAAHMSVGHSNGCTNTHNTTAATTRAAPRSTPYDASELQQLFADYQQFKGQCTEAYLTRIERTVDAFLATHFNASSNGNRDGGGTKGNGGGDGGTFMNKAGAKLTHWFKRATAGMNNSSYSIHSRPQPSSSRGESRAKTTGDGGAPTPFTSSAGAAHSTQDAYRSPIALPSAVTQGGATAPFSVGTPTSSALLSMATTTIGEQSSTRRSQLSRGSPPPRSLPLRSLGTGIVGYDGVQCGEDANAGAAGGRSSQIDTSSLAATATPTEASVPYPMYPLHYTADAVPDDYIDRRPSDNALRAVVVNYPILLHALKHLLPPPPPPPSSSSPSQKPQPCASVELAATIAMEDGAEHAGTRTSSPSRSLQQRLDPQIRPGVNASAKSSVFVGATAGAAAAVPPSQCSMLDSPPSAYTSPGMAPAHSADDGFVQTRRREVSPPPSKSSKAFAPSSSLQSTSPAAIRAAAATRGVSVLDVALAIIASPSTLIPYDAQAHLSLCEKLILPLVQTIWREYLNPLLAKLNEYIVHARAMVRPLLLDAVAGLTALSPAGGGNSNAAGSPSAAPLSHAGEESLASATPQQQQQYLRMYQSLQGDAEYIATIALMDTEFVTECRKAHRTAGGLSALGDADDASTGAPVDENRNQRSRFADCLRGAACGAMSDYVPVYGLIMSRLHRLEMEHRTVLELWGGPNVKMGK